MRGAAKKYLILAAVLFLLLSLPLALVEKVRGRVATSLGFFWKKKSFSDETTQTLKQLETENFIVLEELKRVYALLAQQNSITAVQKELEGFKEKRRADEHAFLLGKLNASVPAKVIYQDPANFASSVWIDVGEVTNQYLGRGVVAKNSPVVLGRQAVGVIDFVGKKQSRVRLITDAGLHPSVRAVRGFGKSGALFLAKGTLDGAAATKWRKKGPILRGVGFNYDFDDAEGVARDLVSESEPIIEIGDLLITTGMDGVFPTGLKIGTVTHIYPLKEGAFTYSLDAKPDLSLDNLTVLFVLPKVGYQEGEEKNR